MATDAASAVPAPSWNEQDDHAMFLILRHLPPRDVQACSLVCRGWAGSVARALASLAPRPEALPRVIARFTALSDVSLTFRAGVPSEQQLCMLGGLRSLARLHLEHVRGRCAGAPRTVRGLAALAATPRLTELELHCFVLTPGCGLEQLPGLRCVRLPFCVLAESATLAGLLPGGAAACSDSAGAGTAADAPSPMRRALGLEVVDAEGLAVPSPAAYAGLAAALGPRLRQLSLRHATKLGDALCAELAGGTLCVLTSLDLSRHGVDAYDTLGITDAGLAALASGLPALRRLAVAGHGAFTDAGFAALGRIALEELDARQPTPLLGGVPFGGGVSARGMRALAGRRSSGGGSSSGSGSASGGTYGRGAARGGCAEAPPLRALALSGAAAAGQGADALAALTALTALRIAGCGGLTDTDAYMLAPLSLLKSLSLEGAAGLTDIGVALFARAFPRLACLTLTHAPGRVSCYGLRALGALGELEELDLTGCEAVDDDVLAGLLPSLPRLRALALADCARMTDRGCMLIAAHASRLARLNLEYCTRVTNSGAALLGALRVLRHANLHGTGVTRAVLSWAAFRGVDLVVEKRSWWMA